VPAEGLGGGLDHGALGWVVRVSVATGSPVKRAKRRGFLRNVAVALGNWGSPDAVPVLARLEVEEDEWVREELEVALRG
jgi:epoxyqueuosine reductase QueG